MGAVRPCVRRDPRQGLPVSRPQLCEVLNATEMTCQAPALALGPDRQSDLTERPEEFGFILDNVQSLLILNKTNFTYYPNPVFEAFGPSGILELKPGTPIILKVERAAGGQEVGRTEAAAWKKGASRGTGRGQSHGLLPNFVTSRGSVIGVRKHTLRP